MRLLLIQPSRKTVHDLGEWPGAAPQPLAPPEDDGFYWLSAERPELEVQLPAVQALHRAGVINGMPDGSFQPYATATREQACIVLCAL